MLFGGRQPEGGPRRDREAGARSARPGGRPIRIGAPPRMSALPSITTIEVTVGEAIRSASLPLAVRARLASSRRHVDRRLVERHPAVVVDGEVGEGRGQPGAVELNAGGGAVVDAAVAHLGVRGHHPQRRVVAAAGVAEVRVREAQRGPRERTQVVPEAGRRRLTGGPEHDRFGRRPLGEQGAAGDDVDLVGRRARDGGSGRDRQPATALHRQRGRQHHRGAVEDVGGAVECDVRGDVGRGDHQGVGGVAVERQVVQHRRHVDRALVERGAAVVVDAGVRQARRQPCSFELDSGGGVVVDAAVGDRGVGRVHDQRGVASSAGVRKVEMRETDVRAGEGTHVVPVAALLRCRCRCEGDPHCRRALRGEPAAVEDVELGAVREAQRGAGSDRESTVAGDRDRCRRSAGSRPTVRPRCRRS